MDKKLTLSLDRDLIEWGKEYVKREGTSLSELLERSLKRIREREEKSKAEDPHVHLSPVVRSLVGIIPRSPEGESARAARYEYLDRKFDES